MVVAAKSVPPCDSLIAAVFRSTVGFATDFACAAAIIVYFACMARNELRNLTRRVNACMRSDPRPPTRRQIKARILNDAYYRPVLSMGFGAASLYIYYLRRNDWDITMGGRQN